jgi:hypothetical protein
VKDSVDTARALYLELAAVGCDLRTGEIGELAVRTLRDIGRAKRLLVCVRVHGEALRELLVEQQGADMLEIREERAEPMPDKSWKATERRVAEILGGERVPVNGRIRGSAPDIAHDSLSLEVKSRKSAPAWLTEAMEQAEASSRDGRFPVSVIHVQGKPYADALCVMRLEDLASYMKRDARW